MTAVIRYQIMLKCWEEEPRDRPTFVNLKDTMKEMERNHKVNSALDIFLTYNLPKKSCKHKTTQPRINLLGLIVARSLVEEIHLRVSKCK